MQFQMIHKFLLKRAATGNLVSLCAGATEFAFIAINDNVGWKVIDEGKFKAIRDVIASNFNSCLG